VQSVLRTGWLEEQYSDFNKLRFSVTSENSCITPVVELHRDWRFQNMFGCEVLFLISK
jgi:hypothetical protein